MLHDIVRSCRTYRRFHEDEAIEYAQLKIWVDTARLVASSGNAQPLRYAIVNDDRRGAVFACCAWAKALAPWPGPEPGERPAAFIVICRDTERSLSDTLTSWDEGIAAQTIMLQATEAGFGGCIIASIRKHTLCDALGLKGDTIVPDLVLALGRPSEQVRIEHLKSKGSVNYWRDGSGIHHVPKRSLDDVLL